MPVCSDLTSQQRSVSGVVIPLGGKVIVDAKNVKSNCRYKGFSSWDFWNRKKVCDHKWHHQITFSKDIKWTNLNKQPVNCTVSYAQPTTIVDWYTNSNVTQLHYQTGLDVILPAMRCAPGKYSNSASGHFHCIQTRTGRMECLCKK